MIEPLLKTKLAPVAERQRRWRLARALTVCWASASGLGLILLLLQRTNGWHAPWLLPLLTVAAGITTLLAWRRVARLEPDYRDIARRIEGQHPELHALLLTAVEQQPDPVTRQLNFLQERVVREAADQARQHRWLDTVSDRRLLTAEFAQFVTLALLIFTLVQLYRAPAAPAPERAVAVAVADKVTVTPGDTTIERGSGLVVLARFDGTLPAEATLVIGPTPEIARRLPLTRNLADPVFGGSILEVASNLVYHVEFAGGRTRDFTVTVFDYPALLRSDARIQYPDYTGLAEKRIEETRRVSAVEGSMLDFTLQLNKPVASARLIAKDKSEVPLAVETNQPIAVLKSFPIAASGSYELQLVDADGRTNKLPAQFVVEALKNRVPELKIQSPRGDQKVSPLQEVTFSAEAWDDFGLRDYGLSFSVGGCEPKSVLLATNASAANERRALAHLLKLEDLRVQPDELITWFLWADDIGPDGKVRRTSSDMFFAEVRPFDEIFREGQSEESQQSEQEPQGQGDQATKLAELQKEIINATWKLQRTHRAASPQYLKDAMVVLESQQSALEKAEAIQAEATQSKAQLLIGNVVEQMKKAIDQLTQAANSPVPLPQALAAEQAAYQALLKLSKHEFQVARSRNSKQQGRGQQASQQQLDQLEMKAKEDRYETQSQASEQQTQQSAEQREQLQALNRLKELAQRQQDLNERIKELQTVLQEAKTDAEREEARRRLKRLREEEQEMLADIDELRQRMERPENQSRMADARQQLDKTRGEVQRAAESLEKESPSQALASGTRAQQELQQLRDEFRKKNSNRFSDEMRQMRSNARELAQQQEEIGKKLDAAANDKRKTLTDAGEAKDLADKLGQQRSGLTNLLANMREVTEKAEAVEPLLARQLYDTLRKNSQANTDTNLFIAGELVKRSFLNEAEKFEQRARGDIQELKQGVERAAESVLGDDIEALRLAKRELDQLTQDLEREIAQAGANGQPSTNAAQQNASGRPASAQPGDQRGDQQGQREGTPNEAGSASAQSGSPQTDQNERGQSAPQSGQGQQPGKNPQDAASTESRGEQAGRNPSGSDPSPQGQQPGEGQSGHAQQDQSQQGQKGQGQGEGQQGQPQQGQGQQGQNQQAQAQQGQKGQGQQGQGQQPGGQAQAAQPQDRQQPQAANAPQNSQQPGGQQPGGPGQGRQPNPDAELQPGQSSFLDEATRQARDGRGQNRPGGGGPEWQGPITGPEFVQWSDRLRNVEEMLDQPELRNEVARVRERARAMRAEIKHHSTPPRWPLVRSQISTPLAEVRDRVAEELARREKSDSLVPIDRDPVPQKFSDLVKRYYEKLGAEGR